MGESGAVPRLFGRADRPPLEVGDGGGMQRRVFVAVRGRSRRALTVVDGTADPMSWGWVLAVQPSCRAVMRPELPAGLRAGSHQMRLW